MLRGEAAPLTPQGSDGRQSSWALALAPGFLGADLLILQQTLQWVFAEN